MRRTDALIVGGGPAGSAAAITLATGGARALLIERSREPHPVVCGAFLGWDAVEALQRLGVDPWQLGARPIDRVRVIVGDRRIERRLPYRAAGLSRQRLDAALLARVAAAGGGVERGQAVRAVEPGGAHLPDGATLTADALFVATGKHGMRGMQRGWAGRDGYVGLRAESAYRRDLEGVIELHLLDRGYAGILLQEDGRSNLCLSVASERLAEAAGIPLLMTAIAAEAPRLGEHLSTQPAEWQAVAGVPYGWRATGGEAGLFRLGDQAAVIASLAGDGIAIALASGRAGALAYLRGGAAAAPRFQRRFALRARRPLLVAEALRHAAERPTLASAMMAAPMRLPGSLRLAALLTRIGV